MQQPFLLDLNTYVDARGKLSVLESDQINTLSFSNFIYGCQVLAKFQNNSLNYPIIIVSVDKPCTLKVSDSLFELNPFKQALYLPKGSCFTNLSPSHEHDSYLIITLNNHNQDLDVFSVNDFEYSYFQLKRFFLIYDVPKDASRGCHAHYSTRELFFVLKGKISVITEDETRVLTNQTPPVYIDKQVWSEQVYMENNSVALVVANENYNKEGYIF